jgi:TonB family protein
MATVVPIATVTSRLDAFAEALNGFVVGLVQPEVVSGAIDAALAEDDASGPLQALLDDALQAGRLGPADHESFSVALTRAAREDLPTVSPQIEKADVPGLATVRPQQFGPITSSLALGPGSVLRNRFVLQAALEASGMSQVFKALDRRRQEAGSADAYVAIKVAGPGTPHAAEAIRLLQQEATTAQRLEHPHIVRVLDFDRDGEFAFMTMEWLEGESLAALLNRQRSRLPEASLVNQVVRDIGAALGFAHSRGITHADVKPGNIFVCSTGAAKLLDFGTARGGVLAPDGAEPTEARTPAYASCEVLEGDVPRPEDDVYSLACVIYRLLAGRRAFGHHDALAAERAGRLPAPIRALPAAQWQALERALAFRRTARTRDIATFLAEFGVFAPVIQPAAAMAAPAPVETRPERSRVSPALLGGAAGAVAVAIIAALLWPEPPETPAPVAPPAEVAAEPVASPIRREEPPPTATPAPPPVQTPVPEAKPAAKKTAQKPKPVETPGKKPAVDTKPEPSDAEARLASFAGTTSGDAPPSGAAVDTTTPAPAPVAGAAANAAAADASPKLVTLTDLKFRRFVEPSVRGRNRDVLGWVEVSFTVDRDGETRDIRVIDSSPTGVHEESALAAVRKWRFQPARENGVAVERRTGVRLRFQAKADQ